MKWKYALLIFWALLLSSCSQRVDTYFYADESWEVSSNVLATGYEAAVFEYLDDLLEQWELPIETSQIADGLTDRVLETLHAQYAAVGIDFQWSDLGTSRSITTKGRSLAQFNQLLPVVMSISKESENRHHLQADFSEFMPLVASFYEMEIFLHVGKIYESNAYRVRGNVAQWINPSHIEVIFAPTLPIAWRWLLLACLFPLALALPMMILAGKRKCPNCGRRFSKKAEYCPQCGEGSYY